MSSNSTFLSCLILALIVLLAGCGAATVEDEQGRSGQALERIVSDYAKRKLLSYQNGMEHIDGIPSVEADRLRTSYGYVSGSGEHVRDVSLSIAIREVETQGNVTTVLYDENIGMELEDLSGASHWSSSQEVHRIRIHAGVVVDDEEIGIDHPSIQTIVASPTFPSKVVVQGTGNPYESESYSSGNEKQSHEAISNIRTIAQSIGSPENLRAYAQQYCSTYNTTYPNYNGQSDGGDCTNFVSQCLEAGGLSFRDDPSSPNRKIWASFWWSNQNNRWDHSLTWSTVAGLRNHTTERFGPVSNTVHWVWEDAHVGDVVFMDFEPDGIWNHACTVTTAEHGLFGFKLRVSCHSTSRCDYNFYNLAGNQGWWIQIQHIP